MASDLLIRGARIIDGTGAPWFLGDVQISDGRIISIGPSLRADGSDTLDADRRYLAPGFIDAHCHDDLVCLREPERIEKAVQGVTTLVVGNCSFRSQVYCGEGPGPSRKGQRWVAAVELGCTPHSVPDRI